MHRIWLQSGRERSDQIASGALYPAGFQRRRSQYQDLHGLLYRRPPVVGMGTEPVIDTGSSAGSIVAAAQVVREGDKGTASAMARAKSGCENLDAL